ncbi:hypothetical protein HMPREF1544_01748 [Mucor circinelloides 1006PhL]|uniref:MULE transposase domain-containing protein n=1 Tax=Mucor circinelloides f. circinelloides (strain 1006PhL) TaxID=1220926 RepID=S2JM84_MUCC1|nr:hypothetical protein HMPREF1544_01748 [Mucor circinelloides 1006PhL]
MVLISHCKSLDEKNQGSDQFGKYPQQCSSASKCHHPVEEHDVGERGQYFRTKVDSILRKYSTRFPASMDYMKRNYLDNNWPTYWVAAFQPLVFTNMETNNYIESWHNQLKTVYLHRKRNRMVDRLIYILVNDVEPDSIQNISRITLKIGRMGPEERRRELDAEAINEAIVSTMINEFADD